MGRALKTKLPLKTVLQHCLPEIEKTLGAEIVSLERVTKAYGANANSFIIKVLRGRKLSPYFLKFGKESGIRGDLTGISFVKNALPTPRIVCFSKGKIFGYEWILFEYIDGNLMADTMLALEQSGKTAAFYKLEEKKERLLKKFHAGQSKHMNYEDYRKAPANRLFSERFLGQRFKEFYGRGSQKIPVFFDRRIAINGKQMPRTISQIFADIKRRYERPHYGSVKAIRSHGDAHHGNVIVNRHIWFIDDEYAGYATPFMEIAKPYYNDMLGFLFFHRKDLLEKMFKVCNAADKKGALEFDVVMNPEFIRWIKLTRIKLNARKTTVNKTTKDFLPLNDYLVMCHALTKDPNAYPRKTALLFILFTAILAEFDPLRPESICDYFKPRSTKAAKDSR